MILRIASSSIVALLFIVFVIVGATVSAGETIPVKRVPAEWEPQEAIWLQWPGRWEKSYESSFARLSNVIVQYETLHILYDSPSVLAEARSSIKRENGDPDHPNIRWHWIENDSAWMRDNGPIYVIEDNKMRVQNWAFNAWGGAFGADIPFRLDNQVPSKVAKTVGLPVDVIDIVHERGNLEFNGVDTVILNWSVIGDSRRNQGYTKERAITDLKKHFGVSKVVFIEGVPEGDLTNGHIDGIARFINPTTVVVVDCMDKSQCGASNNLTHAIFDAAAKTIEAAGFTVIREPIEGTRDYQGYTFDTNYMNWLVGNGFVITVGFDNPETDSAAKARLEQYFPGRDVYVIETLTSWAAGGGVHCHTSDQPAIPPIRPFSALD
ncbi:MAG: agmatine deiminase family protein [Proteobacteria bacterium]|nr:agmatine deiminase family protein [Pseudomonadota bacterium]